MSATQDKSQKFKFIWDVNYYLLWKRGEFNTEVQTPIVVGTIKEKPTDERSNRVRR